jgi:pyruvate dehydrogenase E2 component (dihydrolipoamide acetyltransferase)
MSTINIEVPDIGDFTDVPVIEVLVKPGDRVELDAPLVTLESDKATMDIPAPAAGVIGQITVKVGDRVSQGATIGTMEIAAAPIAASAAPAAAVASPVAAPVTAPPAPAAVPPVTTAVQLPTAAAIAPDRVGGNKAHASPSMRAFARELGVDLLRVTASGPKGRITREDINAYVKGCAAGPAIGSRVRVSRRRRTGSAALAEGGFREIRRQSSADRCRASASFRLQTCRATG